MSISPEDIAELSRHFVRKDAALAVTTTGELDVGGALTVTGDTALTGSLAVAGTFGVNGATPAAKPAVTGSRGSNAALASLLTKLAAIGLITDSSS